MGVLAAVVHRERTGRGQHVEVNLLSSAVASLANQASSYLATGTVPRRLGNHHPSIAPYGAFRARDGLLAIAVGNDRQWALLTERSAHRDSRRRRALRDECRARRESAATDRPTRERTRSRRRRRWIDRMGAVGIPAGKVNDVGEAMALAAELGLDPTVEVGRTTRRRCGIRCATRPSTPSPPTAPPALDADRAAVVRWLEADAHPAAVVPIEPDADDSRPVRGVRHRQRRDERENGGDEHRDEDRTGRRDHRIRIAISVGVAEDDPVRDRPEDGDAHGAAHRPGEQVGARDDPALVPFDARWRRDKSGGRRQAQTESHDETDDRDRDHRRRRRRGDEGDGGRRRRSSCRSRPSTGTRCAGRCDPRSSPRSATRGQRGERQPRDDGLHAQVALRQVGRDVRRQPDENGADRERQQGRREQQRPRERPRAAAPARRRAVRRTRTDANNTTPTVKIPKLIGRVPLPRVSSLEQTPG